MSETNRSEALERLAELERRAASDVSSSMARALSRQRFLARLDEKLAQPKRGGFLQLRWALPALALAGVAAALALWLARPAALTFEVKGAELSGKYVSAPPGQPAELRFSDDSTVVASSGSRLRVEDTSALGARVLLERGSASVRVVHKTSTAWSFAAGPFDVRVTGTRFDLSWDAARETCELSLHEGAVEVRGPTGSGPVVMRAGQRFQGDAQRRTMQVVELTSALGTLPTTSAPVVTEPIAPTPPGGAPSAVESLPLKPTPATPRSPSWSERITQGKFDEIVSEAEGRGVPGCLSGCSAADLRALSDAARYTGKSELAKQALLSMRQRFPGRQGSEAAFLLGRLEEKRGAMGAAQTWYDTYLREATSGAFAAEALAGKLRAVKTTQGTRAAAPLAREYLTRFPNGVHVSTAREILGEQ